MRECTFNHKDCRVDNRHDNFHPTRLVDVGPFKTSTYSSPEFRVVQGSVVPSTERYVTLSHRWPAAHILQLFAENIERLQKGTPISALPRTFRDAFIITRRLGVRYIWIDCLCIIQSGDDGRDWQRESRLMGTIYANALCNIAADWPSELGGMLSPRDLAVSERVELNILRDRTDGSIFRQRHTATPCAGIWDNKVTLAPLNQRGWVFQERLLAPRVIHFCRSEVFWECGTKTACESFPARMPSLPLEPYPGLPRAIQWFQKTRHLGDNDGHPSLSMKPAASSGWKTIVEQYSTFQLTKASDKLIAIAGLAACLCAAFEDQYVAGMWIRTILCDLTWYRPWGPDHRDHPANLSRTPSTPSFSWASIDGTVSFRHDLGEGRKELVQILCIRHRGDSPSPRAPES